MHHSRITSAAVFACGTLVSCSLAGINGFVETFSAGAANWRNSNGASVLAWSPSGGPGDAAFVSGTFNLASTTPGGFPPTVIRAAASYGSSGGAYVGDWISAGITTVSFLFRHDLPQAITVTGRFATPVNTPGASVVSSSAVLPQTWTRVTFDVRAGSPDIVSLGGGTYSAVFSNIGNIQLGFNVPASLAGQDLTGTFSMTDFSIVPGPGALALISVACRWSRRRRER